ncbi:atp-dependent rna helicase dbp3 [Holotrichia oblita]|uniref:Atp-dependent rna helicase dbp3 n=1 Tax=Holotrichia oblita TaxID=644536 RepID=A0ACB9TUK8_HOLOL|nr:atp-dependent rna helicase dbp3 [Holotrichia oblita]
MTSIAHNYEDKPRTKDVLIDEELQFNTLLLSQPTLSGLGNASFRIPSPIQLKAIPIGKCGFDLIIKAKSGTGKAAVFSIIALELINTSKNAVQVLVLAPAREIAIQIETVLQTLGASHKGLCVRSFIGGLPFDQDIKNLNKCHIAVGAPGRVKHLIESGALKTNAIKLLVLDEADKLVSGDMKFDINYISKKLPLEKQVIAASATYSENDYKYLETIMSGPTLVEPTTDTPLLLGLKQYVSVVKSNLNVVHQLNIKNDELLRLLSYITFSQSLVFTNYQTRAESISNILNRKGWNSTYISGLQSQPERLKAIRSFREGKCRVLLSTDVSARGIDVENVDLVINYDVPLQPYTYLHRLGRAGRFGSHGICVTIAAYGKELNEYRIILGSIGGNNIFVPQLPTNKDLPNDLWNIDTSAFQLIQGILDVGSESLDKCEIINSVTIACKVTTKGEQTESLTSVSNVSRKETDVELSMENFNTLSRTVENFLEINKLKEQSSANFSKEDAASLLKVLATDQKIPKQEMLSPKTIIEEHVLDNILNDSCKSKKRKRNIENNILSDNAVQEEARNPNHIKCKNLALLNTTKLLCESYEASKIPEEVTSALDPHLKATTETSLKESGKSHTKIDVLNSIASGKVDDVLQNFDKNSTTQLLEDVPEEVILNDEKSHKGDLEDIFTLSYGYAITSGKAHWLDVLGAELTEKMSITDKVAENHSELSCNDEPPIFTETSTSRKHKSKKKKTFKDFTQRHKRNKTDFNDQTVEAYMAQDISEPENQIDSNYQAGLYSDYQYCSNEHFTSCFNHYSDELTQKLQTFEDVASFERWFADWQWQVQGDCCNTCCSPCPPCVQPCCPGPVIEIYDPLPKPCLPICSPCAPACPAPCPGPCPRPCSAPCCPPPCCPPACCPAPCCPPTCTSAPVPILPSCITPVVPPCLPICTPCPPPCVPVTNPCPEEQPCVPCNPPQMMVCYRMPKANSVKRSNSRELRASVLYTTCDCIKRNGLQDDCPRSECHGQPECLTLPEPTCGPAEAARTFTMSKFGKNKNLEQYQCYPAYVKLPGGPSPCAPPCCPPGCCGPCVPLLAAPPCPPPICPCPPPPLPIGNIIPICPPPCAPCCPC